MTKLPLTCAAALTLGVLAIPALAADHDHPAGAPTKAVAVLFPVGGSGVTGVVHLEEMADNGNKLHITGTVRGLEPNSKHGFHVHEFGDLTDLKTGKSTGGHFGPEGSKHGKPDAPAGERHVGDLGNIMANDQGVAKIDITDAMVTLHGEHSVIGRGFVVHAGEDKFTQPTGDAGDRLAFGTIGVAKGK